MPSYRKFLGNIRRADTPFYAFLYKAAKWGYSARLPVPGFLTPGFRSLYHVHFMVRGLFMRLITFLYWEPILRARCERAGENLVVTLLPDISSNVRVHLGHNVHLNGHLAVLSGKLYDAPRLVVHDNVHIGHLVTITVNREIVIEEGVLIASNCYFADTDAHPVNPEDRAAGKPLSEDRVRPVRICRNAWIGHSAHVMKGVTVGEGAIVAACSVVTKDVPPYSVVAGNPARVVVADVRAMGAPPNATSSVPATAPEVTGT